MEKAQIIADAQNLGETMQHTEDTRHEKTPKAVPPADAAQTVAARFNLFVKTTLRAGFTQGNGSTYP